MQPIPYTQLIPPGWHGHCAYCHRRLTVDDWRQERVVAVGTGDPWHCLCTSHIGHDRPEYHDALMALARAVLGGP